MLQGGSIFAQSPSFNSHSSDNFAEIAAKVCEEFVDDRVQLGLQPEENDGVKDDLQEEEKANEEETEEDDEFEFCFLSGDGIAISADEIFADGKIRPVFPVFNRDLLFAGGKDYYNEEDNKEPKKKNLSLRKLFIGETREEEEEEDVLNSCSSSEADELENLPAGTYCVWKPKQSVSSPDTCKKSKSTGSSQSSATSATTCVSKRWRFRDFLFRSNSDGKNTFVFLTPARKEEKLVTEKKLEEKGVVVGKGGKLKTGTAAAAAEVVSAHEMHYVRNRALKENDRNKSYLPYRKDLVGFFANVNGLNRNLRPF
ncbi:hypothetical protein MKW94_030172 [Papaver nudicaule]|uniref:Uncharacterized protein n=1 Tax=Papaver nudicaule TaxID=74823 RepID=A0AA41V0U1_PAPNU|nr:hypothetical protein [Papaver nudicaule]